MALLLFGVVLMLESQCHRVCHCITGLCFGFGIRGQIPVQGTLLLIGSSILLCRDHVDFPEDNWYYKPVNCAVKGCGAPVGLANRFRYIALSCSACKHCVHLSCPFTPDMMEPEPVTLVVKIYDRVYNIRYPSLQRVEELMLEFATQCKGRLKPSGNRRYFICIHCGKNDFSNKLMLNQHRYEEGCDEAVYPDGTKALLLPYPDFLPGQGKMVEGMKKTCVTSKGKRKTDAANPSGGEKGPPSDDDDFDGSPPSKKHKADGGEGEKVAPRGKIPPSADILFGPAQPRAGKGAGKYQKAKVVPERGPSVATQGDIPNVVSSPAKVSQSGGTGRGLLIVAKGASRCMPVHPGDGEPQTQDDQDHQVEHAGEKKTRRRRVHFAPDSGERSAEQEPPAPPLPAVSRSRLPQTRPPPVIVCADTTSDDVQPSDILHGFQVKRRAKLATRPAKDLKLPSKPPIPVCVLSCSRVGY